MGVASNQTTPIPLVWDVPPTNRYQSDSFIN